MKSIRYKLTVVLVMLAFVSSAKDKNQWSGEGTYFKLWSHWTVGLDLGVTSYFGDLSQYDVDVFQKLKKESRIAHAFSLTKRWHNCDFSGQFIYGGFKSDYKVGHEFKTTIYEYNIQFGAHLINMLAPYNDLPFEIKPYVGAGQFMFKTIKYGYSEGQAFEQSAVTGVPEFVYFFGGRFEYEISDRINLSINLSVRQAQNDNVDLCIKNNNMDYYTFTSIGIQYSIFDMGAPFRKQRLHRNQKGLQYRKSR